MNRTPVIKTRSQKHSHQRDVESQKMNKNSLDKTFVMKNLIDLDQEDDSGMKIPSLNEIRKLSMDEKIELILNKCLVVMSFNEKLQTDLTKCEKLIGDLVKDMNILHQENNFLKEKIEKFDTHAIQDLKHERLKQKMMCDEVEFWGVEETENEDIIETVIKVANDFKVHLDQNDIIFANRRKLNMKVGHNIPRTIRVKFYNRMKRDLLVKVGKTVRLPRSENVEERNGRNFVYINEALTKHMEYMYGKTRELKRKNRIDKTWCKNGRIFIQRGSTPPKLIETVEDLNEYI